MNKVSAIRTALALLFFANNMILALVLRHSKSFDDFINNPITVFAIVLDLLMAFIFWTKLPE